jgi:hypothetical protein
MAPKAIDRVPPRVGEDLTTKSARTGCRIFAGSLIALTIAGCGSTLGTKGAISNHNENPTTTTSVPQSTAPNENPPEGEASYKDSAQAISIEELVDGRVNAPNLAVGTVVTFTGVIQQFLYYSSGHASGLIIKDATSSTTVCVQLSTQASTADQDTLSFMNVMDMVTIWGEWQGTASVANHPPCPTTSPTVVSEMYLTDTTTGNSDGS